MIEKFENFKNLSFLDKCKFIIKFGIYISVFLEIMQIAIEKFQAIDLEIKPKLDSEIKTFDSEPKIIDNEFI